VLRRFFSLLGGSLVVGLVVCCAVSIAVQAAGHNMADYPLRVHIFQFNGHSHYADRKLDRVDGEGRADLFENGQPRGFDFSYLCNLRLMASPGFETYPARWKKRGQTLEILQPVMGKPGAFESCEMKVSLKADTAYFRHNGGLDEEPASAFKEWMAKHKYDPEHGLNIPQAVAPASGSAAAPAHP
jgi:hypothetical protein